MKTNSKIILAGMFSLLTFSVSAQSNAVNYRPVSKEVQKVSNKAWLTSEQLLTVASVGYPPVTISKGVQLASNHIAKESQPGNMVSIGYPIWTISKGVHKIARPVKKEPKRDSEIKDVIV
jgi:hypothetical protein